MRSEAVLYRGSDDRSAKAAEEMRPLLAASMKVDEDLIHMVDDTTEDSGLVLSADDLPPVTVHFLQLEGMATFAEKFLIDKVACHGVSIPRDRKEETRAKILDLPPKTLKALSKGAFFVCEDGVRDGEAFKLLTNVDEGMGISEAHFFDATSAGEDSVPAELLTAAQRFCAKERSSAEYRRLQKDFVALAELWNARPRLDGASTSCSCSRRSCCSGGCVAACWRRVTLSCGCGLDSRCGSCGSCGLCARPCCSCESPIQVTVAGPEVTSNAGVHKVVAPHVQIVAWSWSLSWSWPPMVLVLRDWFGSLIQLDLNAIFRPECRDMNRGVASTLVAFGIMGVVLIITAVIGIKYKCAKKDEIRSHAISFGLTCWTLTFPMLVTVAVRWLDWGENDYVCIEREECSAWNSTCLPARMAADPFTVDARLSDYSSDLHQEHPYDSWQCCEWDCLAQCAEHTGFFSEVEEACTSMCPPSRCGLNDPHAASTSCELQTQTTYKSPRGGSSHDELCARTAGEGSCYFRGHPGGCAANCHAGLLATQTVEWLSWDRSWDNYDTVLDEWPLLHVRDETRLVRASCWHNREIPNITAAKTWEMTLALVLAVFWLVILVCVVPLRLFILLKRARQQGQLRARGVFGRLGVLFERYRDDAYYYELLSLEFRFLLILVGTLIQNAKLGQCLCMVVVGANLIAQWRLQPFAEDAMFISLNRQVRS